MRWSDKILTGGIGCIALLAGVKADTIWTTETVPASTIWSTMWSTVTSYVTKTLPASTVSIPYTVTTSVEYYKTTAITVTSISISVVTSVATKYSEKDFTTTVTQPTTVTDFITKESPTTVTDFVTKESATTVTDFVTQESPTTVAKPTTVTVPVTIPMTVTDFVTQESPTTVTKRTTVTEESPTTVTDFVTQESPTTVTKSATVTEESPTTVTDFVTRESPTTVTKPTTVTVPVTLRTTVPTTVIESFTVTSTPLTGIVLCPSRTINPTYTTSNIPASYLWGCPPGTVCTPPKVDCNFEQNPPADTYYCSPDECKPIKPETLPELNALEASAGDACGPYPTISDEPFNFNPSSFGLGFTIFECGGCWAQTCTECSTAATETVTDYKTEVDYKTEIEYKTEVDYKTITDYVTVIPTTTETPKSKTTWGGKEKRQAQSPLPQACYAKCDDCLKIAIASGKVLDCSADSNFSNAYGICNTCIGSNKGGPTNAADILRSLAQFTSCAGVAKRGVQFTLNAGVVDTPATATTTPATTPKAMLTRGWRHAVN